MTTKSEFIQNAKEFIRKNNFERLLLLTPTMYGRLSATQLKKLTELREFEE